MRLRAEQTSLSAIGFCPRRQPGEFPAADAGENGLQKSSVTDVRQGIAGGRRHVAPALLLC